MTLEKLFRKIRRGRQWRVARGGLVYCSGRQCPLAAVSGRWGPTAAAKTLGISKRLAWKIAIDADNQSDIHRAWLLKWLRI